ncbi:MAG: nitrate- and nitrite sensing domain-containing protein [Rickettsiales bacterium]
MQTLLVEWNKMDNSLNNICNFIHGAQKERGLASLYLQSKDGEFTADMESQFSIVDKLIIPLSSLPKKQSSRIEAFLTALNYLPIKRKYVISRMLEPADSLAFYTRDIIAVAIDIAQEMATLNSSNNPIKVAAFINFLQWKERVGLERAMGVHLVDIDWSNATEFKGRIEYIISEQQAYERMFLALADEQVKKSVNELNKNNNIFKEIEEINNNLSRDSKQRTHQPISAQEWFSLFAAKMDLLHKVGVIIIANLSSNKEEKPVTKPPICIPEKIGAEGSIRARMDAIQKLPLFSGMDVETLQDILKYARIVSHNKGAMIFMQGEQATRFYIVMEGWVKLFKGNADGQESILHVMSTGETLLETVIFNNSPFPVNSQAVDDVVLLSIPASIIREKLQNNKELAMNMLSTVAGRSQAMINQFEQLTLKTVSQRVGWFMLKLFLENGERNKKFKLPYDKALIAGYLGMKPETFSRTLQTLKGQGINIEKDSVNLPSVFALCGYCDTELAEKCSLHNTEECPNPVCDS